ncbi:MAG: RNA polymerase sigma factor [Kofleriaceae bacterium]
MRTVTESNEPEPTHARLRRLLEPHHDRALVFARSVCRSAADGDDLFQEALLRALGKLDTLREDAAFRPWLYRVIISVHRNRYRTSFWRRMLPFASAPSTEPRPDDLLAADERARAALSELPHEMREALVLFEIEGWKVEEISALLSVSTSTIKSRLARGRDRLRTIYARRFGVHDVRSSFAPSTPGAPGVTR